MPVCILCIYMFIHTYVYIYVCARVYICICVCVFIPIYTYIYVCVCIYVDIHVCNFPSRFWKFVLRHVNLFSIVKSVVHSCLTSCVGCISGFRFSRFEHSYFRQWLARCISECYALERIAHCRRRWVQFLHLHW